MLAQADGSAIPPQIKDAEGRTNVRESERILKLAAGDIGDVELLKQFIKTEQAITGRPLVAGNRVTLLIDGPAAYEAMFAAIRKAKDHIHLETFILADDEIGHQLADLLRERCAAGVQTKIIYDAIGSFGTSDAYFDRLYASGIQLYKFHPIDPSEDIRVWRVNQRDHRKLLIVDGRVAFTGGMNVSDVYSSSSFSRSAEKHDTRSRWRDTQIKIEGPAVAEFQRLFLKIWAQKEENNDEEGEHNYFPSLNNVGQDLVRVVASTGGDNEYHIYEAYLSAILHAQRRIWITQAYFSPNEEFLDALKDAARRGVDVRILLPGFTDSRLVFYTSRANYTELLKAGVKLYERADALLHAKTAVIDGVWSTVGSSNLNYRSFLHDNEANAVIIGRNFGRQMEELFLFDLNYARPITLEQWKQRSLFERLKEQLSTLFDYWF